MRKSRGRYDQLCKVFQSAIDNQPCADTPGPAHGLTRAMLALDGHVEVKDHELILVFPKGTRIPLHFGNKSYLKEVIRESAAHVILAALSERTQYEEVGEDGNNSAKRGRKDIVGSSPHVDEGATKKLLARRTM